MRQAISTSVATAPPSFWTVAQVAEFCNVRPRTVYAWVAAQRLRCGEHFFRPAGTNRLNFDPKKVREWFTAPATN